MSFSACWPITWNGTCVSVAPMLFDDTEKDAAEALRASVVAQAQPIACTDRSTRRVETPPTQTSWITATRAFSEVLRGSRRGGKLRLVLHTAAYWLMLTVRDAIPKSHPLASAEFTTLRVG